MVSVPCCAVHVDTLFLTIQKCSRNSFPQWSVRNSCGSGTEFTKNLLQSSHALACRGLCRSGTAPVNLQRKRVVEPLINKGCDLSAPVDDTGANGGPRGCSIRSAQHILAVAVSDTVFG
jgi:hypothetical protein